jgi:tetratricopeptide (TPR) repeat protein
MKDQERITWRRDSCLLGPEGTPDSSGRSGSSKISSTRASSLPARVRTRFGFRACGRPTPLQSPTSESPATAGGGRHRARVPAPLLALLLLILIAPVLGAQQPASGPDALLQQAVALHQAGDLDGAIRAYREYLATAPDSLQARSNLGAVLARAGRYDEAIAEYTLGLRGNPDNPALLLNLGLAYYKTGRHAEAAVRFERALTLAPQFREQVTLLLAVCYNNLGRYQEAVALLAPIEKDKAGEPGFDYIYGTALIGDGQEAGGTAVIKRILSRGDSAEAYLLRGTLELTAHDRDGARSDLEKAVSLNPHLAGAHARLGELLLAAGESEPARAAFAQELALDPDEFTSNLNMGVLAKEDQVYAEARRYLERALKTRPNDPGVRYQMATLDLASGNFEPARQTLEVLIKETPEFAEAHATLATVYYRLNRGADGDRERAVAQKLMDQRDAVQAGSRPR